MLYRKIKISGKVYRLPPKPTTKISKNICNDLKIRQIRISKNKFVMVDDFKITGWTDPDSNSTIFDEILSR